MPERQDDAEGLFAAWAVLAEAGESVPFEDLLLEHPNEAEALKRLHADWLLFAPLLGRAVPGRLGDSAGIVLAPISHDGEDQADQPSPELIKRLGLLAPDAGRYRFRAVLGRGGGGVVLKVWDNKLNRALAMKVVLGRDEERPDNSTPRVDARSLTRFVDEARIASQLNHPGIVPVHELGTDESGRAFFTMKLVKGEDLAKVFEHVKTGHDSWNHTRVLGVLLRVCESVAFAHEKGVIHRDLKPANIMVGRHGEVYVMDWGLARVLGEEDHRDVRVRPVPPPSALLTVRSGSGSSAADSPLYTMDGDVVGTPAYMSPEQAAGRLDQMGPHSDVYAVGAMIYHLLAGHMPYVPEGAALNNYAVWQRAQEGAPPPLDGCSPPPPVELAAICEKAMAREIAQRYLNMRELAEDLRAFLEGRVVSAYETGAWAETRKWVKRHRALAASLGVVIAVVFASAIAIKSKSDEANQSARAREEAEWRAAIGERAQADALWRDYLLRVRAAASAYSLGASLPAHRLLEGAPKEHRGWEWYYLHSKKDQSLIVLSGHTGPVRSCAFSPDGTQIATASDDRTARIWNSESGVQELVLRGHEGAVTGCAFSPDGGTLLTCSEDGTARLWGLNTGTCTVVLTGHEGPLTACSFSPDGSRVLTASKDETCRVWKASGGAHTLLLRRDGYIRDACFSPDGAMIAAVVETDDVVIWSSSGKQLHRLQHDPDPDAAVWGVITCTYSRDSRRLFSGSWDGTLRVWQNGEEVSRMKSLYGIQDISISPDDKTILIATLRGRSLSETSDITNEVLLQLWTSDTQRVRAEWRGHDAAITGISVSPDGARAVTSSQDGTARIWSLDPQVRTTLNVGHTGRTVSAHVSTNGKHLLTHEEGDAHAILWDLGSGARVAQLEASTGVRGFSRDGSRVITSHTDGGFRAWSVATGRQLSAGPNSFSFNPQLTLAVRWAGEGFTLWSIDRNVALATIPFSSGLSCLEIAWSPDGRWMASPVKEADSYDMYRVAIIDSESGEVVRRIDAPYLSSLAFDRTGSRLAGVDSLGGTTVWEVSSGATLLSIPGEDEFHMWWCGFSPNGRFLARVPSNHTLLIYDFEAKRDVAVESYQAGFGTCVFAPDSKRAVVVANVPQIVDPASGAVLIELPGSEDSEVLGFSPDGSQLLIEDGGVIKIHQASLW